MAEALAAAPASHGLRKWAIVFTASLAAMLEIIDTNIVNVALVEIQGNLGATLAEVGWVVTGYAVANVVVIPMTAWLGDLFGKKSYFIFSLVAFTAASVLCGVSSNLYMLIVARILQGFGGGGLLAKAQSILFENFAPEEQGMAQAIFGVGVIAGPAIGPTLGGYLTDTLGWRWIFFINLPVGLFAAFMAQTFLPEDDPDTKKPGSIDWPGILLLGLGLICLQILLEEGQSEEWFESRFIVLMAVLAGAGLILFVFHELRADHPVVDLRVLRYSSVSAGSIYSMVLGMGLYGALFAIPVFAQSYLHFTATQTGELLIPGALASAVTMILLGRVIGKMDARVVIAGGSIFTAVVMYMFADINPATSEKDLYWPLIFRGVATVMMFLPLSLATLSPVPKKDIASASGFYNLTRQMGGSIGIATMTTILAHRQAVHRANLAERITEFSTATQERLAAMTHFFMNSGLDPDSARQKALGMLDGILNGQAAILSFADIFRLVGILFLISLPLIFFLGKGGKAKGGPAH
ncbi:MAG: DHA2 family efflux MFS transporter permease subunit [Leptospiraceae bacterium]|nr:DHA2 family efflux MFS transporter permease subunit [Leptospiraceae bacterium]